MKESDMVADTTGQTIPSPLYNPPGGILLWIIILLELATFGIALLIMAYTYSSEREIFHQSASTLNTTTGSANTVVLLGSGYFMALCVRSFKAMDYKRGRIYLAATLLSGMVFIIIKLIEYAEKVAAGQSLGSNIFMDFYWLLTGFHLIHVIVGMVILSWIAVENRKKKFHEAAVNLESGAAFWHLCDLIWLLLFPVLYLLFKYPSS